MGQIFPFLCLTLLLFALMSQSGSPCYAQKNEKADTSIDRKSGWQLELAPDERPYPGYVADPRRPRMEVALGIIDSQIPETSSGRVMLDAGTRFSLLKVKTGLEGINDIFIDIEGGLFSQFDTGNEHDSIGWDGVYGVFAVYDWSDSLDFRVGFKHLSAHLGDEYMEETGRQRINYTRSALAIGLCWQMGKGFTSYLEPSWAWHLGNGDRQRKWAVEGGIQYQGQLNMWHNSTAFYSGLHVSSFQESDWEPDVSIQAGYLVQRSPHSPSIRLALTGYTGRAVLREFALDYDESYLTADFILDFY